MRRAVGASTLIVFLWPGDDVVSCVGLVSDYYVLDALIYVRHLSVQSCFRFVYGVERCLSRHHVMPRLPPRVTLRQLVQRFLVCNASLYVCV